MRTSNLLVFSLLAAPLVTGGGGLKCDCGGNDPSSTELSDAGTGARDAGGLADAGPSTDACNSGNCPGGCCLEGSCFDNHANYACGSQGSACVMCPRIQSCQQEAVSRLWKCLPDRNARWSLRPVSATIPPVKPDGSPWDEDGSAPEVRVTLGCPVNGRVEKLMTEESSSFTPTFTLANCVTTLSEFQKAPLTFEVADVDGVFEEEIFTATHLFTDEEFAAGTLDLSAPGKGGSSLRLQLKRAE